MTGGTCHFVVANSALFVLPLNGKSSSAPLLLLSPKSCIAFGGPRERSCPLADDFVFLLRFQPKQQTALATFFSVPLLGFEEPCFFEVTDPAADGGGRELEV